MVSARRLLILGGSGFLGAHVARAAERAGTFEVVIASREPVLPRGAGLENVRTRKFDALVRGNLARLLDEVAPHGVVLCTALPTIAACAQYPVLARALNVGLPGDVARWTADHVARLVFVSTDLVFGAEPPTASMYREEDAPSPMSEYGRTKADGEAEVLRIDRHALVARLALLYGDSFGRGLGASDALRVAIERGEEPSLFTDEWRTPIDVAPAARALVRLLDTQVRGFVHVAGRERLSRHELGVRVFGADAHRIRATTRSEAGLADRPRDVSLDTTLVRAILGERWDSP
jgi:dTDP-4-dehydrorhamnose reductase